MQDIQKQIEDDVSKVIGDKNTLAAIDDAIESNDYGKKFHANWMIARGFYNLGFTPDWCNTVGRANWRIAQDPDELGCKMAFIDWNNVETIIIPGKHGSIFMRADKSVELYDKYSTCNLDVWMALDGVSLKQTLLDLMTQGLPFMGLIPILDMIIEKKADREEMTRLHAKFRSFLA